MATENIPGSELIQSSGEVFLDAALEYLKSKVTADIIIVGAMRPAENERVAVHRWYHYQGEQGPPEYDACTMPCFEVLTRGHPVLFTRDVPTHYPDDPIVKALGFDAYVGVPLKRQDGTVIGLVNCEWFREISQEEANDAMEVFLHLSQRLGQEISHLQSTAMINYALSWPLSSEIEAPFDFLSNTLCESLMMREVYIARCKDHKAGSFVVLSSSQDGVVGPDAADRKVRYSNAPWGVLLEKDMFLQSKGLREACPHLAEHIPDDYVAYFGVALRDRFGVIIGHVGMLHDREISDRIAETALLKIALAQIRRELLRVSAERDRDVLEAAMLVKRKSESLGLLAGTIAHDFNNILASMIGNLELGVLQLPDLHPSREFFNTLDASIKTCTQATRRLLRFAGSESTDVHELEPLSVVVRETMQMIPAARTLGKSLRSELDDSLLLVAMDRAEIGQLVLNLVLNALDATSEEQEGIVNVRTGSSKVTGLERREMIFCSEELPEQCAFIEVSDNGVGMDSETTSRMFDPYFTTKVSGTGLGLAAAIGIIQRHGGGMTLSSTPGEGTIIGVFLAPHDEATVDHPEPTETSVELGLSLGKILVVDDDDAVRRITSEFLETLDYETISASGGREALDVLQAHDSIWAALIDVTMPRMDGWETLSRLREIRPDLKVLMVTGFGEWTAKANVGAGDVKILAKPFRRGQLRDAIRQLEDHDTT